MFPSFLRERRRPREHPLARLFTGQQGAAGALLTLSVLLATACASGPVDDDYAEGRSVYRACASCHGPQGKGGAGPALTEVRTTFPDCVDHQRWIALGSEGWQAEIGETYGAGDRPVEGGMPSFRELTDERIAQAALYERVRFGGADLETEKVSCGLAE